MLLLDEKYRAMLAHVVANASQRVYVVTFRIDSHGVSGKGHVSDLLRVLARKKAEGVDVKVLLDYIAPLRGRAINNAVVARWLCGLGIEVKHLPRNRCIHAKFVCVDGKELFLGSHNWTLNSLSRNFELSICVNDPQIVRSAENVFLSLFQSALSFVTLGS